MKTKKVSKGGFITVPADMRREAGFAPGSAVDIQLEGGKVIMEQHTPKCKVCSSTHHLVKLKDLVICCACVGTLAAKVEVAVSE